MKKTLLFVALLVSFLLPCFAEGSILEREILTFLEMGKTKEEIADRFFISVNTVKFHTNKIYNKLQASNASEAVWLARQLGIIK